MLRCVLIVGGVELGFVLCRRGGGRRGWAGLGACVCPMVGTWSNIHTWSHEHPHTPPKHYPQASSTSTDHTEALGLSEWPNCPPHHVLLTPPACRTLWRQFVSDSNLVVQQAVATQDANRAASNRMPPVWALAAIVVLGWNEFVALVYNPLWLMLVGFVFFFGRVWRVGCGRGVECDGRLLHGCVLSVCTMHHHF